RIGFITQNRPADIKLVIPQGNRRNGKDKRPGRAGPKIPDALKRIPEKTAFLNFLLMRKHKASFHTSPQIYAQNRIFKAPEARFRCPWHQPAYPTAVS